MQGRGSRRRESVARWVPVGIGNLKWRRKKIRQKRKPIEQIKKSKKKEPSLRPKHYTTVLN